MNKISYLLVLAGCFTVFALTLRGTDGATLPSSQTGGPLLLFRLIPHSVFSLPLLVLMISSVRPQGFFFASLPVLPFALATLIIVARRGRGASVNLSSLPAVVICLIAAATGIGSHSGWVQPTLGLLLSVLIALIPAVPGAFEAILKGSLRAALAMLGILWVVVAVYPTATIGECRMDKCGFLGGVLVAGDSGNAIGPFLAAIIPLVILALGRRRGLIAAATLVLPLDLTGGRTSLYAAFIAGAIALLATTSAVPRAARLSAFLITLPLLAWSSLPALYSYSPEEFTYRGELWIRARTLISANPWFGYGPGYWMQQGISGWTPFTYGTHNMWLESLVAVGLVGSAVLLLSFAILLASAKSHSLVVVALLAPLVATGFAEVSVAPYHPAIAFASLPYFLVLVMVVQLKPFAGLQKAGRLKRLEFSEGSQAREGKSHAST